MYNHFGNAIRWAEGELINKFTSVPFATSEMLRRFSKSFLKGAEALLARRAGHVAAWPRKN